MKDYAARIRRGIDNKLAASGYTDIRLMKLGKADDPYVVVVPQANREYASQECYYAHASLNGTVVESQLLNWANSGVMPTNSTPELDVITAIPPSETRRFIIAVAPEAMTLQGGTPATIATLQASLTDTNRMVQNSIYAAGGLVVGLNGGRYRKHNTNIHLVTNAAFADLTAYVSALGSGKDKWLLLSVGSAGAAHVTEGAEFDTAASNPNNYRPKELPTGTLYLGAVRISDGMTSLAGQVQNDSDIFTVLPYAVQSASPGETQADDLWVDTSAGAGAWVLKVRNEDNDGWEAISGSGSGAPTDAKYIVQEANGDLSAEQSLGALTTGLLKNTVTSGVGVLSTAAANTDYAAATHASRHLPGGADPVPIAIDITGTAGETLAQRDNVYLADDDTWYKVDIDSDPVRLALECGVVVESGGITAAGTGAIRKLGVVDGYTGLDAWEPVYAGTTAGGYTQTKPDPTAGGAQVAILKVGMAISTTEVLVNTLNPAIVFAKRDDALADDGTITIKHFSDTRARERSLRAFLSSTVPGSTLGGASHASSNYDTDVALRRNVIASYSADLCTSGASAAASSTETGFPVSQAFDNNINTEWFPSASLKTEAVQYTFGSARTIRRYTITAENSGTFLLACPRTFQLQYWNGSSWIAVDTRSNETGWLTSQKRTYNVPYHTASSTLWRIEFTANNGHPNYMANAAEIEMMEVASYTTPKDKLAQSFQLSGAGDVGTVKLWLRKIGSPTGTLTLTIEGDSTGDPDGTPVDVSADVDINEADLSTSYALVEFELPSAVGLTTVPIYHLVLATDRAASETDYVEWGVEAVSPTFTDGSLRSEAGGTWGDEAADAIFDVLTPSTAFDAPVLVGYWLGGNGDVEAIHGDTALANRDTHSTVKNTTGVTADLTLVVEIK